MSLEAIVKATCSLLLVTVTEHLIGTSREGGVTSVHGLRYLGRDSRTPYIQNKKQRQVGSGTCLSAGDSCPPTRPHLPKQRHHLEIHEPVGTFHIQGNH